MAAPNPLLARAQSQTQANRYAFVIRTLNAKLVDKIRKS